MSDVEYRRRGELLSRWTPYGVLVTSPELPEPLRLAGTEELVFRALVRPLSDRELHDVLADSGATVDEVDEALTLLVTSGVLDTGNDGPAGP